MNKPIVYVHSGTGQQFMEYAKQNPENECIRIEDGNTLRGRAYGQVVRIGTYYAKWNDQEIEESIAQFEENFKDHEQIEQSNEDMGDIDLDYGI